MESPKRSRWRLGLVGTFALASLLAILAIGVAITVVTTRQVVHTQELDAEFHARFVADSVLRFELKRFDVTRPLRGEDYLALDAFVHARILRNPVKRVKLWNPEGTIVYSDESRLVGMHFEGEPDASEGGGAESEVTDLGEEENRFERSLAPKLFSTYVPFYADRGRTTGEPDAVVELYQDYGSIQTRADELLKERLVVLGIGLVVLYALLLPIVVRASRRLRRQNVQLAEQAERLQEQAARLESLLATEQASSAQLRHLNQMKSDFVAVASHELRTPLTAILGYVKTLRRPEFERDPEARAEFLAAIERQGDRLFRLVGNVLTASQVENRDALRELSTVELRTVAEEVREGFHENAARIRLDVPGDLPPIWSDRVRVGEIMANLLDNALKYSPDASDVELGARTADEGVRFWVLDQGVGISREDLPRIFDRFYQTDQSTTRRVGGLGLGLHLVRELTKTLGGRVDVESAPGQGSRFTVTLPLRAPDHPEGREASSSDDDGDDAVARPVAVSTVDRAPAARG